VDHDKLSDHRIPQASANAKSWNRANRERWIDVSEVVVEGAMDMMMIRAYWKTLTTSTPID
jgi:hypothetical protein